MSEFWWNLFIASACPLLLGVRQIRLWGALKESRFPSHHFSGGRQTPACCPVGTCGCEPAPDPCFVFLTPPPTPILVAQLSPSYLLSQFHVYFLGPHVECLPGLSALWFFVCFFKFLHLGLLTSGGKWRSGFENTSFSTGFLPCPESPSPLNGRCPGSSFLGSLLPPGCRSLSLSFLLPSLLNSHVLWSPPGAGDSHPHACCVLGQLLVTTGYQWVP